MLEEFEPIPYKMSVNMKSTMPIKSHLEAVVGDTKVYYLEFILYKGLKIYNLVGVTNVTITFKKADGNTVIGFVNILDAENGKIGYLMGSQEIAYAGKLIATIELYGADGERITSPEIQFTVKEQLDNGNAITSTTEYSFLTSLMTEEGIRVTQEIERKDSEQLRKLSEINRDQEFNTKMTEVELMTTTSESIINENIGNLNDQLLLKTQEIDNKIVEVDNEISGIKISLDEKVVSYEQSVNTSLQNIDDKLIVVDNEMINVNSRVNNEIDKMQNQTNISVNIVDGKITEVNAKLDESDSKILELNNTKTSLTDTVNQKIIDVDTSVNAKKQEIDNKVSEFEINETQRQNHFLSNEESRNNQYLLSEEDRDNSYNQDKLSRDSAFNSSEINRSNIFDGNEQSRQSSFNNGESSRQSTFTTNETSRQSTFNTNENTRNTNENIRKTNETTRITNEVTRQDSFTQMLRTSNFNFRPPVNTLSVLSSTYPNPQIGWCVQILNDAGNTGRIYRWSGTSWEWVLTLSDNIYSALISSPKYVWVEEKTVTSGNKTLTLTNTVVNGQRLQIVDKKYACFWFEGANWSRTNQVITFLSSMPENLTFSIMNLG